MLPEEERRDTFKYWQKHLGRLVYERYILPFITAAVSLSERIPNRSRGLLMRERFPPWQEERSKPRYEPGKRLQHERNPRIFVG